MIVTEHSAAKNPATMLQELESGFSLSEQAHHGEAPPPLPLLATELQNDNYNDNDKKDSTSSSTTILEDWRQSIMQDMMGSMTSFASPLEWTPGQPVKLPNVYCDFTASHQALNSIEDYLRTQCLPAYGNTHTNTSWTGSQSTAWVSEARQIIGEMCGAKTTGKASQDVVLFAGNGCTSAVELLIDCLGLKHYIQQQQQQQQRLQDGETNKPVVFVGPHEHHSNLLPWRELGYVNVETVQMNDETGQIDLRHLRQLLEHYSSRTVKIGAFSAASNVTGMVVDDIAITALLHQFGALSVWDYATAASYLDIQMNPSPHGKHDKYPPHLIAKDAVYFSGHKLLGGVSTPGVLVLKKHLVSQQNPPTRSGGGTVFYVTEQHHRFLSNRVERFEGGTPNIVGIWRLGLASTAKAQWKCQLSLSCGNNVLEEDYRRAQRIQQQLAAIPNLVLVDDFSSKTDYKKKLPIFSFLIQCGHRFLHYNYVCALLNDVFGIQSRGGCQCAGPYAQYLLGLQTEINAAVEESLVHTKDELLRPGFTRISLPTMGTTQAIEDYVLQAIAWVAQHGWKMMHVYRCNHRTGEWRHKSRPGAPLGKTERKWLSHYHPQQRQSPVNDSSSPPSLAQAMETANRLLQMVIQDQSSLMQAIKMSHDSSEGEQVSQLRWYVYPKEVAPYVQQSLDQVPETMNRQALLGAIRPIAWFPRISNQQHETVQDSKTMPPVVTAGALTLQSGHSYSFREGEYSGNAPLEEIQRGFDDGELTEDCLIYDEDSWEPIVEFLKRVVSKTSTSPALNFDELNNAQKERENDHLQQNQEIPEHWVSFRDGEHAGQAPMEEIEAGFEEGELSASCQIYNVKTDQWEPIEDALGLLPPSTNDNQKKMPVGNLSLPAKSDILVVSKHEKKKPQRDATAWGQGSLVPLVPPNASHGSTSSETELTLESNAKSRRRKHIRPPPKLMRLVTQAMIQWDMIEEGDRLLLGLSGGKDSLSLLHVLLEFQKKLPIKFEIEVCTVDPMTPSFDPSTLIPYVESLGLKYHYIRDDIVERANSAGKDGKIVSSLCSYCARMKRGNLYSCARKNRCNKLVLAQHLDDLAESFMMSVMHNGFLRTMKANYKINAGDLSVIRPLVYCRESITADFAKAHLQGLVVNENCPACFEEPKERARIKKLLSKEETLYPNFYDNIKRSLLPLMHDDATAILRSYTEEAVAKSRKDKRPKVKAATQEKKNLKDDKTCNEEEEKKECSSTELVDHPCRPLDAFSDDELVRELARRRAEKYKLAGAMKRTSDEDDFDPSGQVCTLNGGNGSIPCRELME